ncbi:glycoside hydrolase family 2 [Mucilaginibacter corticis]|uniref:beta-galactosidase n=1 Tax=Mucilaginibacter corticis TaxID=2597670 RepID=A0A556MGA1_9SPHI|nr:glycoside hydrolase family 2 TIM barrel-domain containing protein [Mucilaginibacter corticis]TSJ38842.1 glycoside hydrolase family 2 [Mucilaginibacter corticis]
MKQFLGACLGLVISLNSFAQSTIIKYLSGTDKDHTVQWDFFCTDGRLSGKWTKIAVPSCWELQGFGGYNYGGDKNKFHESGQYKHEFTVGPWTGKRVFIVFEGSMTDTKVMINGKQAGPIHQGSFYRFKYDITDLVKFNAQNLLEVTVDKMSAEASVNDAERNRSDFWVFGGIFRPVYLEVVPATFIAHTAVNAKADGSFQLDVYAQNLHNDETVTAQVQTLSGQNVEAPFSVPASATADHLELKHNFDKPALWSSEFPNLYQVVVTINNKQGVVHTIKQKFGFRTIEVRPQDGIYVNGAKTVLKGTCRHSFWPETGRTLSHKIQVMDVKLMKEMNNNAVRMSHYPPDADFLDVCDSLGVYVLDELTGWQAKYDTIVGHKLVKEMVIRDVNHPSVVFWDNGNEGGFNFQLDNDYSLYDPQKRVVLHPWSNFDNVDAHHYPDYNYITKTVNTGKDIFMPTEFMHGLYDGGAGAALEDFWDQMVTYPHLGGGFIWAFLDESVIRTDKNNTYDGTGNRAPDGILGPHREKEASFYTIKEIWSPVYIKPKPIDKTFNGKIEVENRYVFTKLSQCKFKWQLVKLPSPQSKSTKAIATATGAPLPLELAPGEKGTLDLHLPATWAKNDALYLTAYGPHGEELFTWSWAIKSPAGIAKAPVIASKTITKTEGGNDLVINANGNKYYFDKTTGYIEKVVKGKTTISLSGGPVLAGVNTTLKKFTFADTPKAWFVNADYEGDATLHVKWTFEVGKPVKLDYTYTQTGDADFMGITFNYPEDKVTGMKWLGRGPYRVWKNRVPGQQFGVWHKDYNNTITGENWGYPEFKGYHGEVNWAVIENKEAPFTVYSNNKNMFLQMYRPAREQDALSNNNVEPSFPDGNIGFLDAISPIGTKFQAAKSMGPQSQKNHATGQPVSNTLWFEF